MYRYNTIQMYRYNTIQYNKIQYNTDRIDNKYFIKQIMYYAKAI